MRVLSDGARRLINEMKKLRLSLIFNEQARARARARERGYNGRWSPDPDAGGPRNITSPSRVARTRIYMHTIRFPGVERVRSFGRIRGFPVYFLREEAFYRVGRCARRLVPPFGLVIVKYKQFAFVCSYGLPILLLPFSAFARNE